MNPYKLVCKNIVTYGSCPYINCRYIHDVRCIACDFNVGKFQNYTKSDERDIFFWPQMTIQNKFYEIDKQKYPKLHAYSMWNNFINNLTKPPYQDNPFDFKNVYTCKSRLPVFIKLSTHPIDVFC